MSTFDLDPCPEGAPYYIVQGQVRHPVIVCEHL